MIRTLFFYIAIHSISILNGYSQTYSSIKEVIQSVNNDIVLKVYDTHIIDLYKEKFKVPVVEEINFRTETDRNNFERQEFALRTMFNGFNESKYFSEEKNIIISEKLFEKKKYINNVLFEKYKSLIKLKSIKEYLPLYEELKKIYTMRLAHIVRLVSVGESVQAKDILNLEEDIYKMKVEIKEAITSDKKERHLLKLNDNFVFPEYTSIEKLLNRMDTLMVNHSEVFDEKYLTEKSKNINKYNQERASDKRILDYLQLRYSRRDNLLFQDEFSLGVGLRLPYSGVLSKSKARLSVSQKEADLDYAKDKQVLSDNNLKIKSEVWAIFDEILFYKTSTQNIFQTLNENHQANIEELNYMKSELKFSTELKLIELEEKLFLKFLEFLHLNLLLDPNFIWLLEQ